MANMGRKRALKSRLSQLLLCAGCAMLPFGAQAVELNLEASAGLGYSDNIGRVATDQRDATIRSVGIRFSALQDSRRLHTSLVGDLSLQDYAGSAYGSEIVGSASGSVRLDLIEERLSWTVEDGFGQTRRDLFTVPSPDNRENINHFSTGPDLLLNFNSFLRARLGARYTSVNYEYSPADSERIGGWLELERQLSGSGHLSLNVSHEGVSPVDEATASSYDRGAAWLRYSIDGNRSSLAFDLGANRVSGRGAESSGLLARLDVARSIGAYSRITLRAGTEFTDSGADFGRRSALDAPVLETESLVQAAQPYNNRFLEGGWTAAGRRTSIGISVGWADERYEQDAALDRERLFASMMASRQIGTRTNATVGILYNKSNFDHAAAIDNDDLTYRAAVARRISRRFDVELAAEHLEFSSSLANSESDETRYWLRVRFSDRRAGARIQ